MEASAVPRVAPAGVAALASPGLLRLLSDDRLVGLIRDGNTNAFEAVYDRHYRAILSFCRHMLGGADEAEDAVQHTFIAAYNDLVSSRKPIRLRAWLFTIARNRCLSILRARRERTALEFEEQATDGLAIQVQRRQDLRDLVVDINRLPDDQRAALVLAEMGALSHDEIGSVIGVPKDKVKALIFQARESLIADRAAREADCWEIREQLATMRGAALRRTTLRRHLRGCQGCREYRHELESQRRRLAMILPVAPTIALREAIVGVTGGVTAGAGVASSGLVGGSLLKGAIGKAVIAALLAAAGTTGTILVVHDFKLQSPISPLHELLPSSVGAFRTSSARLARGTSASARGGYEGSGRALTRFTETGSGYGHESARARAFTHELNGQLNTLFNPVWPHEKLLPGLGAVSTGTHPAPIAPPVAVAPVQASPAPAPASAPAASTPSQPTASLPSSPAGDTSGSGSESGSPGGASSPGTPRSGWTGGLTGSTSSGASASVGSSSSSSTSTSSGSSAATSGSSAATSGTSGSGSGGSGDSGSGSGSPTGPGDGSGDSSPVSSGGSGGSGGWGSGGQGGGGSGGGPGSGGGSDPSDGSGSGSWQGGGRGSQGDSGAGFGGG